MNADDLVNLFALSLLITLGLVIVGGCLWLAPGATLGIFGLWFTVAFVLRALGARLF